MEDVDCYKKIFAFKTQVDEEARAHLQKLMPKWIQSKGESEHYACAIALLHTKLNNALVAISFLQDYVIRHENKWLAVDLLADLYYNSDQIDQAIKLYESTMRGDYSDGEIVNKYLRCLSKKECHPQKIVEAALVEKAKRQRPLFGSSKITSLYFKIHDGLHRVIGSIIRIGKGLVKIFLTSLGQKEMPSLKSDPLLKAINHILKNHVYDIGVENLHLNIHIATKIIRDAQKNAIQRGVPPVILMSSGCAASTATLSMLSQRIGTGGIALQYQSNACDLVEEAVKIFARGGLITRLQNTLHDGNVREVLSKYGLKKVACIIRDPRECLVSYCRMVLQCQCLPDQEQVQFVLAQSQYADILNRFKMFHDFVWTSFRDAQNLKREFNISLLTFNEFKNDPIAYIKKIVDFYNIPDAACLTPYDQLAGSRPENASNRAAIKTNWRDFLTSEIAEEIEGMIKRELIDYFKWPDRVFI